MDGASEADRRSVSVAHLAMSAALFCYALLIWLLRGRFAPEAGGPRGDALALPLLSIGVVQYFLATWFGRKRLPGSPGGARSRVRSFFLIRFAAAEAIGVFGLIAGFLGARFVVCGALLAASLIAMLASAPTREAWEDAVRRATT